MPRLRKRTLTQTMADKVSPQVGVETMLAGHGGLAKVVEEHFKDPKALPDTYVPWVSDVAGDVEPPPPGHHLHGHSSLGRLLREPVVGQAQAIMPLDSEVLARVCSLQEGGLSSDLVETLYRVSGATKEGKEEVSPKKSKKRRKRRRASGEEERTENKGRRRGKTSSGKRKT